MTIVLAVESATDAAGVALVDERGVLAAVRVGRGRRHAETVAPGVQAVCRYADVPLARVAGVAVDVGPGLFTGLRVGIATAKGLAYGLGVPMVPVSSLRLLADGAARFMVPGSLCTVLAVVDARRQEVFWASYPLTGPAVDDAGLEASAGSPLRVGRPEELDAGLEASAGSPPRVGRPEELAVVLDALVAAAGALPPPVRSGASLPAQSGASLPSRPLGVVLPRVLVVGDGARRYAEVLRRPGVVLGAASLAYPSVELLGAMGVAELRAGRGVDPATVAAFYLREADARINWERRAPRRAGAGDHG
ncbi:MAG: tRNA (adenosine(37)-N6)-threonylcarbamoyltransferase complex dimerization subunit type 1 TsaB [Actinomycetota bacterium]|nr:tRNA (adenosine(37)-N6)-threonylcarbamoyltransferase complex dimerization subunit type 1 TsaB [Actinomycetota bacterium]